MTRWPSRVDVDEDGQGRYSRQRLIEWWDQQRVRSARVLVAGAGALGNEILKLLSLLGIGRILVYDMDIVESSNLSRGILFREGDEGRAKATVTAERLRAINSDVTARGRVEDVVHGAGLGVFAWADVVLCGVDNREARVFINSACSRTGRIWIDGGIEGFSGIARVFDPSSGPCYECTMNETDRKLVAERRSCAMLARDIAETGSVPNTAIAASLIAALQVQEAMKTLHGRPAMCGEGLHVHGDPPDFSRVKYLRRDGCLGHDCLGRIEPSGLGIDATLGQWVERAEAELGDAVTLEFSRDLIYRLTCPGCGKAWPTGKVVGAMKEREAACPDCGALRLVDFTSSVARPLEIDPDRTLRDIGVPAYDVIVARNGTGNRQAWLLDVDAESVLGPLAHEPESRERTP